MTEISFFILSNVFILIFMALRRNKNLRCIIAFLGLSHLQFILSFTFIFFKDEIVERMNDVRTLLWFLRKRLVSPRKETFEKTKRFIFTGSCEYEYSSHRREKKRKLDFDDEVYKKFSKDVLFGDRVKSFWGIEISNYYDAYRKDKTEPLKELFFNPVYNEKMAFDFLGGEYFISFSRGERSFIFDSNQWNLLEQSCMLVSYKTERELFMNRFEIVYPIKKEKLFDKIIKKKKIMVREANVFPLLITKAENKYYNNNFPLYLNFTAIFFYIFFRSKFSLTLNLVALFSEFSKDIFLFAYKKCFILITIIVKMLVTHFFDNNTRKQVISFLSMYSKYWKCCDKELGVSFKRRFILNPIGSINQLNKIKIEDMVGHSKYKEMMEFMNKTVEEVKFDVNGFKVIITKSKDPINESRADWTIINHCNQGWNFKIILDDLKIEHRIPRKRYANYLNSVIMKCFYVCEVDYVKGVCIHNPRTIEVSDLKNREEENLYCGVNRIGFIALGDFSIDLVWGIISNCDWLSEKAKCAITNYSSYFIERVLKFEASEGSVNKERNEFLGDILNLVKNRCVSKSSIGNSKWKKFTFIVNKILQKCNDKRIYNITERPLTSEDKRYIEGDLFEKSTAIINESIERTFKKRSMFCQEVKKSINDSESAINKKECKKISKLFVEIGEVLSTQKVSEMNDTEIKTMMEKYNMHAIKNEKEKNSILVKKWLEEEHVLQSLKILLSERKINLDKHDIYSPRGDGHNHFLKRIYDSCISGEMKSRFDELINSMRIGEGPNVIRTPKKYIESNMKRNEETLDKLNKEIDKQLKEKGYVEINDIMAITIQSYNIRSSDLGLKLNFFMDHTSSFDNRELEETFLALNSKDIKEEVKEFLSERRPIPYKLLKDCEVKMVKNVSREIKTSIDSGILKLNNKFDVLSKISECEELIDSEAKLKLTEIIGRGNKINAMTREGKNCFNVLVDLNKKNQVKKTKKWKMRSKISFITKNKLSFLAATHKLINSKNFYNCLSNTNIKDSKSKSLSEEINECLGFKDKILNRGMKNIEKIKNKKIEELERIKGFFESGFMEVKEENVILIKIMNRKGVKFNCGDLKLIFSEK